MKIARMLGATAVLFASLTLFGAPQAFACDPDMTGCSSSGSSSSGSSGSGSSSSGDSSGDSGSSGSSSSGHSSGDSNSCDSDCQKKKQEKKKKKDAEPSTVVVVPPQNPTPRTPVRRFTPVAPAAPPGQDFVPPAPAETPVLEQDAVSRGFGELLPAGASVPVADSTPTAGTAPGAGGDGSDGEGDAPDAATPGSPANVQLTASSAESSPPWLLIGGGLAVGLLGAGLAFAPSKKPPLPPPPPMNPMNHYPGY